MSHTRNRRRTRKKHRFTVFFLLVLVVITALAIIIHNNSNSDTGSDTGYISDSETNTTGAVGSYNLDPNKYPQELIELLERNPETETFVLEYPTEHDVHHTIDLSEYEDCTSIPLFLQWDQRWGYESYGGSMIALSACGPTCLSMVSVFLLQDTSLDPLYMANYSEENGYYVEGNGTSWELMVQGAEGLGLDVTEIPLNESRIAENLEVGNPIICCMGPGDFTTSGHYIVLTGYSAGMLSVNDPNSVINSETLWSYDDIEDQIRNIWVYRTLSKA